MPERRPTDWSASWSNAEGLKSRSFIAWISYVRKDSHGWLYAQLTQPTQRSVTVTVTDLPWYVALIFLLQMGLPRKSRSGTCHPNLHGQLTVRITTSVSLKPIKQQLRDRADVVGVNVGDPARSKTGRVVRALAGKGARTAIASMRGLGRARSLGCLGRDLGYLGVVCL
jgi:hypothetical protein